MQAIFIMYYFQISEKRTADNTSKLAHTRTEKENSPIVFIPSAMRSWVLSHLNSCEAVGPKSFREEIQQIVMEAYQAYTSIQINRSENLY